MTIIKSLHQKSKIKKKKKKASGRFPTDFKQELPNGIMVKNLPANEGDTGLFLGSGRSPGVGSGNPLQYSCLRNPMGRGDWRAIAHEVTKSQT